MQFKAIATFLTLLCTTALAQQPTTFTDPRDNKTYKTAKIGKQVWLAENLNYEAKGSKCNGEGGQFIEIGDTNVDYKFIPLSNSEIQANCNKYGRLYNWAMAMVLPDSCNSNYCASYVKEKHKGICPSGWHIPSKTDWDKLIYYVADNTGTGRYSNNTAGKYLKATNSWNEYFPCVTYYFYDGGSRRECEKVKRSGNGTDDYGFAALAGGSGIPTGYFYAFGYSGVWWSASEGDTEYCYSRNAYFSGMYNYDESVIRNCDPKIRLYSVRCLQD